MAHSTVGTMTLTLALVIVLSFHRQFVHTDTDQVDLPVDVAMVLVPDTSGKRSFYLHIFTKFLNHYKIGFRLVVALVTAFADVLEKDRLVQSLTGDQVLLMNKLQQWANLNIQNPVRNYGAAFRVLPTQVFAHSDPNSAKAVFVVFTTGPTNEDMTEMLETSTKLRNEGGNVYVIVRENADEFSRLVADMIAGDKVFPYGKPEYDETVVDLMPALFKQMDKDIVNRPTMPPTSAPPQPPTEATPEPKPTPEPQPEPTTTSGGCLAKLTPPLQWASCLLIGMAMTLFAL